MYKTFVLFLLQFVFAHTRFLPVGLNSSENVVEETQHAICKISSADLDATANATITRQLKGVCTTSHLDDRINILEKTFILEMNNIKSMLEKSLNSIYKLEEHKKVNYNKMQQIKSLNPILRSKNTIDREAEISKLNMTMQKENNSVKFNYYWVIEKIILSSMNAVESGDFYFAGNHVLIRLYPNYLQSEQMFIQIVDLEEFQLSYRFTVLDQEDEELDITSQILDCDMQMQCTGYKISHNILLSRSYIKNNSLIIKLSIYLHY